VTWVTWNLVLVCLEMLLVLVQDSCMVCAECTLGSKIVLDTLNALLGDEAHLEAHFGPFRDCANLDARSVHGLRRAYHRLGNHFGRTR
jgi:NADH:ubiquinone oxidoreductase subunit F (NADH-binding)